MTDRWVWAAVRPALLQQPRTECHASGHVALRCPPQGPEASLQCSKKLVVTLELGSNKKYETERLDFDVSCVNRCGADTAGGARGGKGLLCPRYLPCSN